jgi:hypothetical protein
MTYKEQIRVPEHLKDEMEQLLKNGDRAVNGEVFTLGGKKCFRWINSQGKLRAIGPPEIQSKIDAHVKTIGMLLEHSETLRFANANEPHGSDNLPIKLRAILDLILEQLRARRLRGDREVDLVLDAGQLKDKVDNCRNKTRPRRIRNRSDAVRPIFVQAPSTIRRCDRRNAPMSAKPMM